MLWGYKLFIFTDFHVNTWSLSCFYILCLLSIARVRCSFPWFVFFFVEIHSYSSVWVAAENILGIQCSGCLQLGGYIE